MSVSVWEIVAYNFILLCAGCVFTVIVVFLFEAARKFRRQEHTNTDGGHRCNCSQADEAHVRSECHINQGYVFTISGRRNRRTSTEPPPAFNEVIKDDKDLPKYEEVMEKPHLYKIEKETGNVQHV